MSDTYYTIIKYRMDYPSQEAGEVKIWKTYGDQIWSNPAYELIGYADSYKEAQDIALEARS